MEAFKRLAEIEMERKDLIASLSRSGSPTGELFVRVDESGRVWISRSTNDAQGMQICIERRDTAWLLNAMCSLIGAVVTLPEAV